MSASYGNVGPGGAANVHHPQKARRQESVNSRRPSWMRPTLLQETALQPTRTRGATSQLAKSNSVLDWLGQGTSDAAGKNLVPVKRPDRGTQNETHIGPFGPSKASISAKAQNTENRQNPDIPQKNPRSTFQPVGAANDQGQTLSGADHSTTNFTPFSPLQNHHGKPNDVTPNNIRQKPFDAVHDPSDPSKKDIIFKMSMPIVEDFQPGLDEFCRLRRLGYFEDAEQQFQYTLKNLQGMPYVLVQYCEMLLAAGRYTSFRAVSYRKKYASLESEESAKNPCLDMLEGNFWLLDLLAKVPQPSFDGDIFEAIKRILGKLELESAMGSTETQIMVLCFTVLGYLEASLGESVTKRVKEHYFNHVFKWNQLYHRLLGENRIWDLRDLLVAAGSLFGPQFITQCLNVKSFSSALDRLLEDWIQPEYDEATNLGLLDLFTSLLLDRPSSIKDDPKSALLLEHAKSLAEFIQVNDTQNMRSRPFIQWIMAKVVSEMADIPIRPDGLRVEDFSGITIFPGPGVHLPVYIPAEPWDKPHWDMYSVRSSPQQRQALQVALQAARFIGDYRLQATCLKILILYSQEPKVLMDSLSTLQFEQGDTEGFLETCLSKYIALGSEDEAARLDLITDIEKLGTVLRDKSGDAKPGVYSSNSFCEPKASFLWARDVIIRILAENADRDGGRNNFWKNNVEFWNGQLVKYGSRLPLPMAKSIAAKYRVQLPQRIQDPSPPPPYLSTRPWEPGTTQFPPDPQFLQHGEFDVPRTMGHPEPFAEPYEAGFGYGSNMNPFAPPTASYLFQQQPHLAYGPHHWPPPPPPEQLHLYHPPPPPSTVSNASYDDVPSRSHREPVRRHRIPLGSRHRHPKQQTHNHDPQNEGIPVMDYDSEDARRVESKHGARGVPLTAEMLRKVDTKKKRYNGHSSHQPPGRRRTRATKHIDNIDPGSSEDIDEGELSTTSMSDYRPTIKSSQRGFYGYRGPMKKPEAPALSESDDLSGQSIVDDRSSSDFRSSSDSGPKYPELDPLDSPSTSSDFPKDLDVQVSKESRTENRTIIPDIKVSWEGMKQNLNILSELSDQHDISIVMTNKADTTTSKVYTVKNGAITMEVVDDSMDSDAPGSRGGGGVAVTVDGIPIPSTRPRTKSLSSMQTVRPLKASILKKKKSQPPPPAYATTSAAFAGPSTTTIQEEEAVTAEDDKSSTLSARVQKANKYMDRKTDKWLKEKDHHSRSKNPDRKSKPRRSSSIVEPKPVRPAAAPGNLVNAISTDDEDVYEAKRTQTGGDTEQPQRASSQQQRQQPSKTDNRREVDSSVTSEEDTGFESNEAVQPSDSMSVSASFDDDSGVETIGAEEESLAADMKGKRRPGDARPPRHKIGRRKYEHGDDDDDERERLVSRLNGTRTRRRLRDITTTTSPAEEEKKKKPTSGAATKLDKGKKVDTTTGDEDEEEDGEKQVQKESKYAGVKEVD